MTASRGSVIRKREREILDAFAHEGFGEFQRTMATLVTGKDPWSAEGGGPEHLRDLLERLGPTFIKLGQEMSVRPDLLPPEYITALSSLQDDIPATSFDIIGPAIEDELGAPIDTVFSQIDPDPIGSASIGQVYRAALLDGSPVVIKIMRPGADESIELDLEIIERHLGTLSRIPIAEDLNANGMIRAFAASLRSELDLSAEGRHLKTFRDFFADDDTVVFPRPYLEHSTRKMLVMEFLDGTTLNDAQTLRAQGFDLDTLLDRGASNYFAQIFELLMFQSDPHLGNLMAIEGDRVGFLDFGRVSSISARDAQEMADLVIALGEQDNQALAEGIASICGAPADTDMNALAHDLDEIMSQYFSSVKTAGGSSVSFALLDVVRRHHLTLPANYTMLFQTLGVLEGDVITLDPDFSIIDSAQRYAKNLVKQRLSPQSILREVARELTRWMRAAKELPSDLQMLIRKAQQGRIDVQIEVPDADRLLNRVAAIINRALVILLASALALSFAIAASRNNLSTSTVSTFHIGLWIMAGVAVWLAIDAIVLEVRARQRREDRR